MKILILILLSIFNNHAFAHQDIDLDIDIETNSFTNNYELEDILNDAEYNATTQGRKILEVARQMINSGEIVVGSCWDFINAAYNRAGFTSKFRKTVYKSKQSGPYANIEEFQPGDWLYFINHSFGDIEHSSVFIAWTDKENKIALMISYAGGNQSKPARYKTYDLKSVYNIIRGN